MKNALKKTLAKNDVKAMFPITIKGLVNIERVTFTELFYGLIFVLCVGRCVEIVAESGLSLYVWGVFMFCFLCALEIWTLTSYLLNKFGQNNLFDRIGQYVSMLLMYFMINSMSSGWSLYVIFNLSWILQLGLIMTMWLAKLWTIDNLPREDKKQIACIVVALVIQMVTIAGTTFMNGDLSLVAQFICLGSIFLGFVGLFITQAFHPRNCLFPRLIERCGIFVILVLGELMVAVSGVLGNAQQIIPCLLSFALAVALFAFIFQHIENVVDKTLRNTGLGFLAVNILLVTLICHVTIALEIMTEGAFFGEHGRRFLALALCGIMIASLTFFLWNKNMRYHMEHIVLVRIIGCAMVAASAMFLMDFPVIMIIVDILALMFVDFDLRAVHRLVRKEEQLALEEQDGELGEPEELEEQDYLEEPGEPDEPSEPESEKDDEFERQQQQQQRQQ